MPTTEEVFQMLDNRTLWDVAVQCHHALRDAGVPHAILGGVAVCLHGYQRNTVDLDLLVRREDQAKVRETLESAGLQWSAEQVEFRTAGGVAVQFLIAGNRAGKDSEVYFPDPGDEQVTAEIEGLPVLTLARLIETKLASGLGNIRRMHRDLADVVELIAAHKLDSSFARHLHKSLRPTFRKLVEQSRAH